MSSLFRTASRALARVPNAVPSTRWAAAAGVAWSNTTASPPPPHQFLGAVWRGFAADSSTSADEEAEVDEEVDEEETGGEEPYDSGEEGEHTSVEDGFTYGESDTYDDEVYAPGSLHELNPEEAGSMFYHFSGVEQEQHLPEGCKGFDKEFELSNSRLLMARRCFFRLLERVAPTVDGVPIPGDDTLLEGPTGVGKTVLLAQLVHWARASGWIVMYTPDARHTLGHSYYLHDKQTDMYDTPDAACRVLKDLYTAHEAELNAITLEDGSNLGELVKEGSTYTSLRHLKTPPPVMSIVQRTLNALQYTDVGKPVMLAVDNYNALFGGSEFLVYPHAKHRRHLGAHELKLCRWIRDMSQPMVNGVRVHATSTRAGVSPRVPIHLVVPLDARRRVPNMDLEEAAQTLMHYQYLEVSEHTDESASGLLFLAGGDAERFRDLAINFSDDPFADKEAEQEDDQQVL